MGCRFGDYCRPLAIAPIVLGILFVSVIRKSFESILYTAAEAIFSNPELRLLKAQ